MEKDFEVRDLRDKERYMTDDKFLNGYARFLEIYAVGVYGSLCRHANKEQRCWPSIQKICEELSISKRSVIRAIQRLEYWRIIKRYRIGKMANNRYDLVSKNSWLPVNKYTLREYSEVSGMNFTRLLQALHVYTTGTSNSKETHSKEIKLRKSVNLKVKKERYFQQGVGWIESKGA